MLKTQDLKAAVTWNSFKGSMYMTLKLLAMPEVRICDE